MSKKNKGKNHNSPYGITVAGDGNVIDFQSQIAMYERLIKEKDAHIKQLENENSMLRSLISIHGRWAR
jgi:hypothetical protein